MPQATAPQSSLGPPIPDAIDIASLATSSKGPPLSSGSKESAIQSGTPPQTRCYRGLSDAEVSFHDAVRDEDEALSNKDDAALPTPAVKGRRGVQQTIDTDVFELVCRGNRKTTLDSPSMRAHWLGLSQYPSVESGLIILSISAKRLFFGKLPSPLNCREVTLQLP